MRSSSLCATTCARAARMPATNGAGELSANRFSAGAASRAKRGAANFECRMVISSKSSTPHRLRFLHTARRKNDAMPSVFEPTSVFQQ